MRNGGCLLMLIQAVVMLKVQDVMMLMVPAGLMFVDQCKRMMSQSGPDYGVP